jgi:fructose-1,6-bisphosphatase
MTTPQHVTREHGNEVENSIVNLPANKYMIQALMIVYGERHIIVATFIDLVSGATTRPKFWMWCGFRKGIREDGKSKIFSNP